MRDYIAILFVFILQACVSSGSKIELSKAALKVKASMSEAPLGYIEIGPVFGRHGGDCQRGDREEAIKALRNNGAELGAEYIRIDSVLAPDLSRECGYQEYTIRGVAFRAQAPTLSR